MNVNAGQRLRLRSIYLTNLLEESSYLIVLPIHLYRNLKDQLTMCLKLTSKQYRQQRQ